MQDSCSTKQCSNLLELQDFVASQPWSKEAPLNLEGCVLWTGLLDVNGYGRAQFNGRVQGTHRTSYELAYGPLPDGGQINHRCRQSRNCLRPDHLYCGSQAQNMADAVRDGTIATGDRHGTHTHPESLARGNSHGSVTHPESVARGEKCNRSDLTEQDVIDIRRRCAVGERGADIAREYDISPMTISEISHGQKWAHVLSAPVVEGSRAQGENHYLAKLTVAQVLDIRKRRSAGESQKSLSIQFGVSGGAISNIYHGVAWAHIPDGIVPTPIPKRGRLTDAEVLEIRRRSVAGETGSSLAKEFNVSVGTVSLIKNDKTHK